MILTRDKSIIMPILNEVLDTFNNGEPILDGFIDREDKLFLYEDGCLFPTTIREDIMLANFHAAVPKECRGKRAVKAAKICIKYLKGLGYTVISSIEHDRKDVRLVVNAAGAKYLNDCDGYRIYKW